jgi:hypothetical protein
MVPRIRGSGQAALLSRLADLLLLRRRWVIRLVGSVDPNREVLDKHLLNIRTLIPATVHINLDGDQSPRVIETQCLRKRLFAIARPPVGFRGVCGLWFL